jgi:hypothetical protein
MGFILLSVVFIWLIASHLSLKKRVEQLEVDQHGQQVLFQSSTTMQVPKTSVPPPRHDSEDIFYGRPRCICSTVVTATATES